MLYLETPRWLVQHYTGMRQAHAFPFLSSAQQQGCHGGSLSHTERGYGTPDILHILICSPSGVHGSFPKKSGNAISEALASMLEKISAALNELATGRLQTIQSRRERQNNSTCAKFKPRERSLIGL